MRATMLTVHYRVQLKAMLDRSEDEQTRMKREALQEAYLVSSRRAAAAGAVVSGSHQANALEKGLLKTAQRIERLQNRAAPGWQLKVGML